MRRLLHEHVEFWPLTVSGRKKTTTITKVNMVINVPNQDKLGKWPWYDQEPFPRMIRTCHHPDTGIIPTRISNTGCTFWIDDQNWIPMTQWERLGQRTLRIGLSSRPEKQPPVAWIARAEENERLDLKVISDLFFFLYRRLATRWSFWGAILQRAEGHIQVRCRARQEGRHLRSLLNTAFMCLVLS
jgi:hypothetical protein